MLLKHAHESEKADAFSKTVIFGEAEFPEESQDNLAGLIKAIMLLAENEEYRPYVEKYVPVATLKSLAIELMEHFGREKEAALKRLWVNDLVAAIKRELQMHTAVTVVPEIDLYSMAMHQSKVSKYVDIVKSVHLERQIFCQDIQGFRIIARTKPFRGAQELKNISGRKLSFSLAFQSYNDPYGYLEHLRLIDGVEEAEYYKYFTSIEYKILNRHGFEVSGGERSEFRLLQEISDAMQYDMLLIDEPESSFDNLFLKSEVNQLIKEISRHMPVIIVTHNNTVGASIRPDFLVYTKRILTGDAVNYEVYFGHPSDKFLKNARGDTVRNFDVVMNCLEAGQPAYDERGASYETLKN